MEQAQKEGDQEAVRKAAGRTVRATKEMNEWVKKMLRMMGVAVVEAPPRLRRPALSSSNSARRTPPLRKISSHLRYAYVDPKFVFGDSQKRPILEVNEDGPRAARLHHGRVYRFLHSQRLWLLRHDPRCGRRNCVQTHQSHKTIEKVLEEGLDKDKYKFRKVDTRPLATSSTILRSLTR